MEDCEQLQQHRRCAKKEDIKRPKTTADRYRRERRQRQWNEEPEDPPRPIHIAFQHLVTALVEMHQSIRLLSSDPTIGMMIGEVLDVEHLGDDMT